MYVQVVREISSWEYSFNNIYFKNTEHLEGIKTCAQLSEYKDEQSKSVLEWRH